MDDDLEGMEGFSLVRRPLRFAAASAEYRCIGNTPALLDGDPYAGVHLLPEFLFMGRLGRRVIARHDRLRDDDADEERVISFLLVLTRRLHPSSFSVLHHKRLKTLPHPSWQDMLR